MKKMFALVFLSLAMAAGMKAQDFAVKTNLLYDATATVNAGFEVGLAPRWSLDVSGNYNAWTFGEPRWKHWMVQPEARYWFCDYFLGHFVGVHVMGGQYNIGMIPLNLRFLGSDFSHLAANRYQGWAAGAGIAYGYAWALGRHWNVEAEAGVGYAYFDFSRYECEVCGRKTGSGGHHYVGPTKLAINLVYVF